MNNNAPQAEIFAERLKRITSQAHQNLEDLPISRSIVDPAVTKEQYEEYLYLMHDIIKDAEDNIFPAIEGIIDGMGERKKTHLLENDLQTLGVAKKEDKEPLSSSITKLSPAFAMGIMYVVEGSTLGGRFILKNINESLGYTSGEGAQYFAGYGNATGSYWKGFINQMTKYEEENDNGDEIIRGATYAFEAINKYFTENTPQ